MYKTKLTAAYEPRLLRCQGQRPRLFDLAPLTTIPTFGYVLIWLSLINTDIGVSSSQSNSQASPFETGSLDDTTHYEHHDFYRPAWNHKQVTDIFLGGFLRVLVTTSILLGGNFAEHLLGALELLSLENSEGFGVRLWNEVYHYENTFSED